MPAQPRATKAEVDRRINAIFTWLLEGIDPRVIATSAAKQFGVTERQARNYIKRARAFYKEVAATDALMELGRVLARNDRHYREAWAKRSIGLCHQLNMARAKLLGLYEPETIRLLMQPAVGVEATDDELVNMSDDDLRRALKGANGGGNGKPVGTVQ